jgi:hypothetical protein
LENAKPLRTPNVFVIAPGIWSIPDRSGGVKFYNGVLHFKKTHDWRSQERQLLKKNKERQFLPPVLPYSPISKRTAATRRGGAALTPGRPIQWRTAPTSGSTA